MWNQNIPIVNKTQKLQAADRRESVHWVREWICLLYKMLSRAQTKTF